MTLAFQPHTLRIRGPLAPPPRPACLNCKASLSGKFCHDCGQAAKTPARITLGAILHELPHAILHLEHALPHTIVALLTRPGHAIREYLSGKRARMYSPFALLFLVSGLLGLAVLSLKLNEVAGPLRVQTSQNDYGPRVTTAIFKYQAWVGLAVLPIVALGPAIALRGRTGIRYGEMIVAAAMTTAGGAMLRLALVPLQWLVHKHWHHGAIASLGIELVTTVYVLWAYAQLQNDGRLRDPVRRWLRAFASMVLTAVAWVATMTVLVTIGVGGVLLWKHFRPA